MYRNDSAWSIYCTVLILLLAYDAYSYEKYMLKAQSKMINDSEKIMLRQVGVTEKTNRNDGKQIKKYLDLFGFKEGTSYCAAGLYWCYYQAYLNDKSLVIPVNKTAVASEVFFYAKRNGKKCTYKAERNDLIVWKMNNSYRGHIERVVKTEKAGWLKTVGFNTTGTINGTRKEGVFIKRRNIFHPLMKMKVRGIVGFDY
jgi:hypothetical protein